MTHIKKLFIAVQIIAIAIGIAISISSVPVVHAQSCINCCNSTLDCEHIGNIGCNLAYHCAAQGCGKTYVCTQR